MEKLKASLPAAANWHNPVDVLGDARADRYEFALNTVESDPNVDAILVIITPQTSTEAELTAEAIGKLSQQTDKPVFAVLMGIAAFRQAIKILSRYEVPDYDGPERAVGALHAMYRYGQWLQNPAEAAASFDVDKVRVQQVLERIRAEGRTTLGEQDARELVDAYGIRQPASILAASADEAVQAAEKTGYPVVMKISSPDILHKSDVGGVRVGVENAGAVAEAFDQIVRSSKAAEPEADIQGVLVQEMVQGGREIILGMTRDAQFGPMIMFGLGGIYVEVLKDVAFSIAPVSKGDARRMINGIRAYKLLTGVRGEAPSDLDAVVDAIGRLSQLVTDFPGLAEADLNPVKVFAEGKGLVAVDARFAIEPD
jgi:acetyltransferase